MSMLNAEEYTTALLHGAVVYFMVIYNQSLLHCKSGP